MLNGVIRQSENHQNNIISPLRGGIDIFSVKRALAASLRINFSAPWRVALEE